MKAYLLDTNAFAMALIGDARLPQAALHRMQNADRLALSVISFYEIGQKVRLGKWPEMTAHAETLPARAAQDGFDILPLTAPIALRASLMDWTHRDPFDRMIAAIAQTEKLAVISSDQAFDELGITRHWSG